LEFFLQNKNVSHQHHSTVDLHSDDDGFFLQNKKVS